LWVIGWFSGGSGVARPRPEKSGVLLCVSYTLEEIEVFIFFLGGDRVCSDVTCFVVAVDKAVTFCDPPGAHPNVWGIAPWEFSGQVLAPVFSFLHFELLYHARVENPSVGSAIFASLFPLLAFLFSSLLSCSCCIGGGGGIPFFLSVVGCENKGEVDRQAAIEDLFNVLIHVDDAVVDRQAVFLLLAEVEPTLDADFESIEDFGRVSEIPGDSYFYCQGLMFDWC
jgi:hypothetical protein